MSTEESLKQKQLTIEFDHLYEAYKTAFHDHLKALSDFGNGLTPETINALDKSESELVEAKRLKDNFIAKYRPK